MSKKLILIMLIIIFLIGIIFLFWELTRIKPLQVKDVTSVSSNNLNSYVGISYEYEKLKWNSFGELNPSLSPVWKDNNEFISEKGGPILISISNQEGTVSEQTLTLVYDDDKTIQIYLPSLPGTGVPWAYFFIDKRGSSYWACTTNQPCDTERIDAKLSLKKKHL